MSTPSGVAVLARPLVTGFMACPCGSVDVQSTLVLKRSHYRHHVSCPKCGLTIEFYRRGGCIHEIVHLKKGELTDMPVELKSSALATAEFNPDNQTIRVRFKNGRAYDYAAPVPEPGQEPINMQVMFISLISAESAGSFFQQHIRKLPTTPVVESQKETPLLP